MTDLAPPKRILLIKLRHHGDLLLSTPVARILKTRFPEAEIDFLVYRETLPIISRNTDIARLFGLDRALKGFAKLVHLVQLYRQLSSRRYDWVIHLSDQWNGALLARLLARHEAVGFDYPKRRETRWSRLFTRLAPVATSDSLHTVEQNLLALEALGIQAAPADKGCVMAIADADRKTVSAQLREAGVSGEYILVHPASRWFFKCWEDERFAALIQTLADDGHTLVLTAAPVAEELALVDSILAQVDSPRIHSLAGKLSLTGLAAAIEGAKLFIGVDSVPMHMAAALRRNTIALFGPSKVNEWHPWMTEHVLIHAADYGPLIDPDAVNTATHERYLVNIPLEPVLDAARCFLEEEKP